MKILLHLFNVLLIFFLQNLDTLKAQSSNYFVSPLGIDTNKGTFESPLKSISKALSIAKGDTINVYMLDGIYFIDNCDYIKNVNRFKCVIIKPYNTANVKLVGGKTGNFKNLSTTKDNKSIYYLDLKKLGVNNVGSIKRNGFGDKLLPSYIELFINNEPFKLARWPNKNLVEIDTVFNRGIKNKFNEPKPSFYCKSIIDKKWLNRKNIWIGGQFSVGWAYESLPVDNINTQTKIIKIKEYANYGIFSSKDTTNNVVKSAKSLRGVYFYNIFEELDDLGEYYVDKDNFLMYFYPKKKLNKGDEIVVSTMEDPFFRIENSSNIVIEGLDFSYTRGKFIEILKCKNLIINNCEFSNSGLLSLDINHSDTIKVLNSKFIGSGAGSIYIEGGNRQTLVSSNNLVSNCEFTNYSRNFRSFTPAINIEGVGVKVKNCYIHDAYDQAILYTGNNHEISFNIIKNVCQNFSDIGAIGTGRDPSSTGTKINNNYLENVNNSYSSMITAVYIDDGSGGIVVQNNVFKNCGSSNDKGFGAIHINGGADNKFINNIFIDCSIAFSNTYWSDEEWKNRFLKDSLSITKIVNIKSDIYINSYPYLKDFFDSTKIRPRINYIYNNVKYGKNSSIKGRGFQIENNIYLKNKPSLQSKGSPINSIKVPTEVKKWSGWEEIEIDKMGILTGKDINTSN